MKGIQLIDGPDGLQFLFIGHWIHVLDQDGAAVSHAQITDPTDPLAAISRLAASMEDPD